MSSRPTPSSRPYNHDAPIEEQPKWPWLWFVVFGLSFATLGCLALGHLNAASMISTFIIGVIMLIGGSLGIGHAISVWHQDRAHFWAISGLFYLLSGTLIFIEPLIALRWLTLIFAVSLAVSGASRLMVGARLGNSPVLISGTASIIAAIVVGLNWPNDSLWVIGLVVAIDLVVQGIALLCAGFALKRALPSQS